MSDVRILQIAPEYFAAMEQLQRDCYPTLGEDELMRAEHFASQCAVFAQGQFVAVADDGEWPGGVRVVGMGSGFFTDYDFESPHHTFREFSDHFYFRTHDPAGAWYYGVDLSVHPAWRGRGVARKLYAARKALVQRENKRGIVAGGLIPGYDDNRHLTPPDYVREVVAGALKDPTLSAQLRLGFRVRGMLPGYIEDSASDNWAVLIEWPNPDYVAPEARGVVEAFGEPGNGND